MPSELAVFEKQLQPYRPRFEAVLANQLPVERLIETAVICVEQTPQLLKCSRPSLMRSCLTFATLALEIDGATGQGYILPFKATAQPVIGYKGYNTLAARSGFVINAATVREGDELDFQLGSGGYVRHRPKLGGQGRIIGAWAMASHPQMADIIAPPMGIDELMAVKGRSPGARRKESPWNDPAVGFPAMCEKTVKRRLARAMPMAVSRGLHMAARMEEAFDEQGKAAFVDPDKGVIVEGEVLAPRETEQAPIDVTPKKFTVTRDDGQAVGFSTPAEWFAKMKEGITNAKTVDTLETRLKRNQGPINDMIDGGHKETVDNLMAAAARRKEELQNM